jgi:hypothetical protein
VDLIRYNFSEPFRTLTIGSDFFTYTLLRGEQNFHFPVDAVDYFFGININYRDSLGIGSFSSRLRISHISAHFVDGHFDGFTGQWKNGQSPRVYSREFIDFTSALEPMEYVRFYLGFMYLWHVDPVSLPTFLPYSGFEYHYANSSIFLPYCAYQFTITGMRPRHEFQAGVKIGPWRGRGTQLFLLHHQGNSIHGEYFDVNNPYTGIGFLIDF